MTDTQETLSSKLAEAIANPIFPALDSQLRAGRHISLEALDEHAFLMDFQGELEQFYRRYHVELIRAPEGFFYLRPKASTLIARSAMSDLREQLAKYPLSRHFDVARIVVDQAVKLGMASQDNQAVYPQWQAINDNGAEVQANVIDQYNR